MNQHFGIGIRMLYRFQHGLYQGEKWLLLAKIIGTSRSARRSLGHRLTILEEVLRSIMPVTLKC